LKGLFSNFHLTHFCKIFSNVQEKPNSRVLGDFKMIISLLGIRTKPVSTLILECPNSGETLEGMIPGIQLVPIYKLWHYGRLARSWLWRQIKQKNFNSFACCAPPAHSSTYHLAISNWSQSSFPPIHITPISPLSVRSPYKVRSLFLSHTHLNRHPHSHPHPHQK